MNFKSITANIGVKNVNETVSFYSEKLGFELLMSVPEEGDLIWAMVGNGQVILMFQEETNLKDEYKELAGTGRGCITFYLKIKDMKELYEQVKDSSMLVKKLETTNYGVDEFAVRDNNGYILTITEA
jgi:uncharacterized glyoxalase superfamily protein PhnB